MASQWNRPATHEHSAFVQRIAAKNPMLARKIMEMRLPLSPLVHICSGEPHPDFPVTILQFWLLSDTQLESLARFYHQDTPGPYTRQYPCPITWSPGLSLEEKRRKIGKFIGLRGCHTPMRTEEEIAEEARVASRDAAEAEMFRSKMHPWRH